MALPFSPNSKLCLVPGLLVALIWQMGACPCGCIHHNVWLEMYASLEGEDEHRIQDASTASVDAHDCDHRPRESFLRGRIIGEDGETRLAASYVAVFFCNSDPVVAATTRSRCRNGAHETAKFSDAQKMRAHLQVYQI